MLESIGFNTDRPSPAFRMRAASTLIAIGAVLWMAPPSADALGFGRVSNPTQLGQPLNFVAVVRLDADETLARECVSAEVISGDNKLQPEQVRATLESGPDATVRVTTSTPIDEPVVTVSVTVGCTAKVTRRFVAFIDPPLINLAQAEPAETLPPQSVESQVAPLVRIVQGDQPERGTVRRPERPPRSRARAVAAPTRASEPAATVARAAAPKPPPGRRAAPVSRQPSTARAAPAAGPRLELESAALLAAARSASAPASGPEAAVAAALPASKPDDAAEQIARERQRIQLLEEGLAKLRADSQATQKALGTLQARLKEAESERYANPLVYTLTWLSALLALAVAGLWWRQSRARHSAQWWAAPGNAAPNPRVRTPDAGTSAPAPLGSTPTAADAFDMLAPATDDDEPPSRQPVTTTSIARPSTFGPVTQFPATEAHRELSVEELIDLEQQAEFFIVLGQDEAAIELLMSHVRSDGGISPLPYLKLLEIYRRRGEGEAYHRIRERFNRRFNAYAPDWDADLQQGRALADYPEIIDQLQDLWPSPPRVMETLDASLFRRNRTDRTFDLPAYRELLFLYSIARDLAEHGAALGFESVDLLLPLNEQPNEQSISRLSATGHGEFQPSDLLTMPLDLDVSFAPAANAPTAATPDPETLPAALRRTPDHRLHESDFVDITHMPPAKPTKPGPSGDR